MATLRQRLYAQSGKATFRDLPELYGREAMATGSQGRGIGGPPSLTGEPLAENLAALEGAGGGAPASGGSSGGFSGGFPGADPISSPGRSGGGVNALRQYFGGAGRSEGGGYGGGPGGVRARESDAIDRGYTSSWGGFADSLSNALGLMGPGVVTTGIKTMAEQGFGLPSGTLGGIGDVRDFHSFDPDIVDAVRSGRMRMGQAVSEQAGRDEAKQAMAADSSRRVGRGYGGPPSRNRNALRNAFGRSGFGGGGGYGGRGALDSHGQVRGGGTGSVGGGLTAGGPR